MPKGSQLTFSLEDKVCVVTGAGKGIGRAIALAFASQGASVVAVSRTERDLKTLADEETGADGFVGLHGDVSKEAAVKRMVSETIRRFDRIDVLVNNAGMRFRKTFTEISLREWERVISNNLTSSFLCAREVGRWMIAHKIPGRIINIASVVGSVGLPQLAAYGASKGGMITLTKCLALEWAPYGINVNAICPGFCETSYAAQFRRQKSLYRFTLERTPKHRWGQPEEIAAPAVFLASEASRYLTGEILHVDGGWCAW